MSDAQALFREGVMALRERKDVAEGRRLLIESLRTNPQNDMAWVWLARGQSAVLVRAPMRTVPQRM